MLNEVYNKRILELAGNIPRLGRLPAPDASATAHSKLCGSTVTIARGIQIGHIFQLGRRYANAFDLDVLGPDGEPIRVTMGSYGIGVSRAVRPSPSSDTTTAA